MTFPCSFCKKEYPYFICRCDNHNHFVLFGYDERGSLSKVWIGNNGIEILLQFERNKTFLSFYDKVPLENDEGQYKINYRHKDHVYLGSYLSKPPIIFDRLFPITPDNFENYCHRLQNLVIFS